MLILKEICYNSVASELHPDSVSIDSSHGEEPDTAVEEGKMLYESDLTSSGRALKLPIKMYNNHQVNVHKVSHQYYLWNFIN